MKKEYSAGLYGNEEDAINLFSFFLLDCCVSLYIKVWGQKWNSTSDEDDDKDEDPWATTLTVPWY